jgi:hypothetical protein
VQTILAKLHASSLHILSLSELQLLHELVQVSPAAAFRTAQVVEASIQTSDSSVNDNESAQKAWENEKCGLLSSIEALRRLEVQLENTTPASQARPNYSCLIVLFLICLLKVDSISSIQLNAC